MERNFNDKSELFCLRKFVRKILYVSDYICDKFLTMNMKTNTI